MVRCVYRGLGLHPTEGKMLWGWHYWRLDHLQVQSDGRSESPRIVLWWIPGHSTSLTVCSKPFHRQWSIHKRYSPLHIILWFCLIKKLTNLEHFQVASRKLVPYLKLCFGASRPWLLWYSSLPSLCVHQQRAGTAEQQDVGPGTKGKLKFLNKLAIQN